VRRGRGEEGVVVTNHGGGGDNDQVMVMK